MVITINTNKGVRSIKVPRSWHEVTTDTYQKIHSDWDSEDVVKLFAILTGEDYDRLFNYKSKALETALINATTFITQTDFKKKDVPREILIDGKLIKIPKNVGDLSIGQSVLVRQKIEKVKVLEECISYAFSVYIQPLVDRSEFNYERAMQLHERVLAMPITETYSIGFFLLSRLKETGESWTSRCSRSFIRYFQRIKRKISYLRWLW